MLAGVALAIVNTLFIPRGLAVHILINNNNDNNSNNSNKSILYKNSNNNSIYKYYHPFNNYDHINYYQVKRMYRTRSNVRIECKSISYI